MRRRVSFFFSSPKTTSNLSIFSSSSSSLLIRFQSNLSSLPNPNNLKTLIHHHYSHGKFHNLLHNVIATPSFLLSASSNLNPNNNKPLNPNSISTRFSIQDLAHELKHNRFDIESCCVTMYTSTEHGVPLILPNLKLKVVIEAIRMVLEAVYDGGFAYGGRVGMGRHTAIRYLKNTLENPSWWFCVRFVPHVFEFCHFSKLFLIVGERIDDKCLIELIERLFRCGVLRVELGGCSMGKGLPQECSLSSILVNIYLSGLDKQLQNFRLRIDRENPKFESGVLYSRVMQKPVKIYAVRYLDEIMVITSGSKVLLLDLKNQVEKYLERVLKLNVDRLETAIHSAVTEKIDFLGMELQAVPPSVLRPPLSEKAIRARKKYTKEKEGRALERKNARETNRKRLGLKIFNHVFKKLKRTGGFTFDFQIESEVRNMFGIWADEVVQEFFSSLDERYYWHRRLSSGDFLSLRAIRNQLPQELVDSYDQFQEQVDKHLTPIKVKNDLDEEHQRIEEKESRKYADRTIEDLTKLCMKVAAPEDLIRKAVRMAGFTNSMGRPRPIDLLIPLEDSDIIKWYAGVGKRWLDFFCCCCNFKMVKIVVSYHLRFSCILTLAKKHDSTKKETIRHYSKDLIVCDVNGLEEVHFPTQKGIKMMGDKNLSDPKPVDGALSMALCRLATDEPSYFCMAHFCDRSDTLLYRIRLLQKRRGIDPLNKESWIQGMGVIHESLDKKCVSLCFDHASDLHLGKTSLQDVDCTLFVDLQ